MVLRKSFYIHLSAGRSPRVHEVNPGRGPSPNLFGSYFLLILIFLICYNKAKYGKIIFFIIFFPFLTYFLKLVKIYIFPRTP